MMGLSAIYQKPNTSKPHPQHKIYPYLLRGMTISKPNQVWCADISYIPMRRGFLYLVVIMDWARRKFLSRRLSNTMDADFCVAALEEALSRYGKPDFFNTDQGSQFTNDVFIDVLIDVLKEAGIRISMDGKGRWMDNIMIERLWRSLKYECIYLHAFETGREVRQGLSTGLIFIIRDVLIQVWTTGPLMRHIGESPGPATPDQSANWRHNHEGYPPDFRCQPVRTTGATSKSLTISNRFT